MRIDDERDLHEQLEAAFEAITPQPALVDGATGEAARSGSGGGWPWWPVPPRW